MAYNPQRGTLMASRINHWINHFSIFSIACIGVLATQAQASSPQHLRVFVPMDLLSAHEKALIQLTKKFNATQKKIQVDLIQHSDGFKSLKALIAAKYASDLPDLALVDTADSVVLRDLGALQPFQQKWVNTQKFISNLRASEPNPEKTYSIPYHRTTAVWFANTDLLKKLSKYPKDLPASWLRLAPVTIELKRMATKQSSLVLQKLHSDLWGAGIAEQGQQAMTRWSALGLGPLLDPVLASLDWVEEMWDSPGDWAPGSPTSPETTRKFLDQQAILLLGTIDQWKQLHENAPFQLKVIFPPDGLKWFGWDFVLLGDSPNQDKALEFLSYLYRPETLETTLSHTISIPVTTKLEQAAVWKRFPEQAAVLSQTRKLKRESLELQRIPPQNREEWANLLWKAVEHPSQDQEERAARIGQLRAALEKILSTNPH